MQLELLHFEPYPAMGKRSLAYKRRLRRLQQQRKRKESYNLVQRVEAGSIHATEELGEAQPVPHSETGENITRSMGLSQHKQTVEDRS
jgi:hypothetical protein